MKEGKNKRRKGKKNEGMKVGTSVKSGRCGKRKKSRQITKTRKDVFTNKKTPQ